MHRMFTHRHYTVIADVLAECAAFDGFDVVVDTFVARLHNDNPKFDEERFREACHDLARPKDARSGKALR